MAGHATSEFVFSSDEGHLIRHSNLIRRWRRPLLKAAKIESESMGHASLTTTYTHFLNVSEDRESQAAEKIASVIDGLRKSG